MTGIERRERARPTHRRGIPDRPRRYRPPLRKARNLRHSFALRYLDRNHSPSTISKLLGYRQPKTHAHYAHVARHSVKSAAEKIANSLLCHIATLPNELGPS